MHYYLSWRPAAGRVQILATVDQFLWTVVSEHFLLVAVRESDRFIKACFTDKVRKKLLRGRSMPEDAAIDWAPLVKNKLRTLQIEL